MYATNINEAVAQLEDALANFQHELNQDAWDLLEKRCQQLSQWIEHGKGVTQEMKPELTKKLFAAEKVLLDNRRVCRRKLYYQD